MKFTEKFKKLVAITLAGAMVLLTANMLPVHAQNISDVSVNKPGYGVAKTSDKSGVNVRDAANLTTSNIIISIPYLTKVMIVGESGDFYKVQYDTSGHYGYMIKRLVEFMPEDKYLQADTAGGGNLSMYDNMYEPRTQIATIPNKKYFAYWLDNVNAIKGIYGNAFGYTSKSDTKIINY